MLPNIPEEDGDMSIVVEKSVYFAAKAVKAEAARLGISELLLADYQRVRAREAGRQDDAEAWSAVHTYLMSLTCLSARTVVVVVPDRRAWAFKGPVRRPRSGKVLQ